ncbi:MAG: GNAT family N-acetyltransferase [Acidobacteria bacterium]|nr:GNAT family N-acetyltransferase [Acidobacteriota bacterium]
MPKLSIRRATPADAEVIVRFNQAMARETEHLELDSARVEPGVAAVLEDASKGLYWLAIDEASGAVVGQLMITYEWSDWRNGVFWWIQSVYVDPAARGQGVYRALYDHVKAEAASSGGVCGIRLYVERENRRAQAVYEKQGMRATDYLMYEVDFVIQR